MLVTTTPAVAAGVVLNVPTSYSTIQAAIDAASNGDTVRVLPGRYAERIDFKGKAIEVGGALGMERPVIDGGGTGPVVRFATGEGRASVLTRFEIRNGSLAGNPSLIAGAGIAVIDASPTIVLNTIKANNAANHAGGGIGVASGSPLIKENWITGNAAGATGAGGGIFAGGGADIVGNIIESNSAGGGAGVAVNGRAVSVRNNDIWRNNGGTFGGGGIAVGGPGGLIVNNVVRDNTTEGAGGGLRWSDTGTVELPYVLNNSFVGNTAANGAAVAGQSGGARLTNNVLTGSPSTSVVWCSAGSAPSVVLSHNDVYNAGPAPYQGCANATGTNGNVSADPGNALDAPGPGSPALDAGDNNAVFQVTTTDFLGNPRVLDGDGNGVAVVDMGAIEAAVPALAGADFHPLAPARILDTRTGNGAPVGTLGPWSTVSLQVTGRGGVPADGVSAVVLNVTVTQPIAAGFLTAWPAGTAWPGSSNLNFVPGQTVANLVVVKVGAGGKVNLLNSAGATHVVADVASWYGGTGTGARYTGLSPARILDTREGLGAPQAKLAAGSAMTLQVTGRGGVPATGVSAVTLNLTATGAASEGWLAAWPAGDPLPLASNVNYGAGQSVPNLVTVKVGAGGAVNLYSSGGPVDVVADVAGYYGAEGAAGGSGFIPVDPARVLDTRTGLGTFGPHKIGPVETVTVQVPGQAGIPATGVASVVLNVTVTEPESEGWLSAWPAGGSLPLVSNLNYVAGQTVPNLVVVKVGTQGQVNLYSSGGPVHVVADVMGWFPG